MSEPDQKPDQLAKTPDQIVGRNRFDLLSEIIFQSKTGTKLDAAFARIVDWPGDAIRWVTQKVRVRRLVRRTDQLLEESGMEPKAIPERVAIEVIENVAREDREELFELWARLMVGSARGEEVDAYHIDLIRKLDPSSARVLLAIADELLPKTNDSFRAVSHTSLTLARLCHITESAAPVACARLIALGLISINEHKVGQTESKAVFGLAAFGLVLVNTLYPDKENNRLSAFLLLQHTTQATEP
jgi:hypothetical protein